MPSLFTQIVNGEVPCHKILEDGRFMAVLEKHPLAEGHAVVFPKKETDYLFDLEDEMLAGLMVFCKKTAKAVKKAFPCEKVAVTVYGLKVRHAHVHLVPASGAPGELDLSRSRPEAPAASLEAAASKIRACL